MSFENVEQGELAAVVTFLEMHEKPALASTSPLPSPLRLKLIKKPKPDSYRRLFGLVGSRWLWFSRLIMDDDTLGAIISDPGVNLHAVIDERDQDVGILELDYRTSGECELAFVGLVPAWSGKGHGRWLLAEALRLAWRADVKRVHVHTCSLDHPAALTTYCRAGFNPVRRAIERFPDPRLMGVLPRACAPQIPIIEI